jgi:hypothetical protein
MKRATGIGFSMALLGVVAVSVGWFSACPTPAAAQSQGNNAVYYYTTANPGVCCTLSVAFIDATVIAIDHSNPDFCATIYKIITGAFYSYPTGGAVIDARGIGGAALTCTHGTPWLESGIYANVPSTILLPATTAAAPIVIPSNLDLVA